MLKVCKSKLLSSLGLIVAFYTESTAPLHQGQNSRNTRTIAMVC